jgi:hypothetical protein
MCPPALYSKAEDKLIGVESIWKTWGDIGNNPRFREGVHIGDRALIPSFIRIATDYTTSAKIVAFGTLLGSGHEHEQD